MTKNITKNINTEKKRRFISFSEMWLFNNLGKNEYYKSYILGIKEPMNEPMQFGCIVHALLADEKYNWQKEIKKLIKEPQDTYERIIKKIIMGVPRCAKSEENVFVDFPKFSLFAGIDGVDDEILTEYKTGASLWTQNRADETEQITHYLLAWINAGNKELPYRLISISSKTGKHVELRTHRTKQQLNEYYEKIIQFKNDLQKLGFWNCKCPFNSRINL